jgi:hypothetical protein
MRIAKHVRFGDTARLATAEVGAESPAQQGSTTVRFWAAPVSARLTDLVKLFGCRPSQAA